MKYLTLLATVAIGCLPFVSFAATYNYVNSQGTIESVQASNATQARAMATDIDPHSGVALDEGYLDAVNTPLASAQTYFYVNAQGYTASIHAADSNIALTAAPDIALHSGVSLNQGYLKDGMPVASVK